jgi:hypothetical protein
MLIFALDSINENKGTYLSLWLRLFAKPAHDRKNEIAKALNKIKQEA